MNGSAPLGKSQNAELDDLILRRRAKRGVSKDGPQTQAFVRTCPSFETPAVAGPQDEVGACFPLFSSACLRIADKVVVGVIASGSTLTCRIEGRPEANARSYAGRNSAVSSTVSPWPPKARA